jgi:hypothetical protein
MANRFIGLFLVLFPMVLVGMLISIAPPLASVALANEVKRLALDCEYKSTLNVGKMANDPTSGQVSILLELTEDALISAKTNQNGFCDAKRGLVSDIEVKIFCSWSVDGTNMASLYTASRVSGALETLFFVNDKLGLIHYGQCRIGAPLF